MNKIETAYLQEVGRVFTKGESPKEIATKLMATKIPDTATFSINAKELEKAIFKLRFDYSGELQLIKPNQKDPYDEWMDEADREYIKGFLEELENVKRIFNDIKSGNLYHYSYPSIDFVYGRLKDGDYSYKIINKKVSTKIEEGGAQEYAKSECLGAQRGYPKDPSYTLEYVKLNVDIVDGMGRTIRRTYVVD
jgi:hypothetical protein